MRGFGLLPIDTLKLVCGLMVFGSLVRAAETPVDLRTVRGMVIYAPSGSISRAWISNATCSVVMVVDPVTGKVTKASIEESSGDSYLNSVAVSMLRQWKFKPGSPRLIRATFGSQRVWTGTPPDRKQKPLNDVLAPSLGNGALVHGFLPDYPSKSAWTNKHGTGVFELHVDGSGQVSGVTVKKSSGDVPFDQVMVLAMRQWRFRRGPMIVELPLYFALTPAKFTVNIPKYP